MEGRAAALGAGTTVNALATGTGAAFGIDVETRATVTLNPDADGVRGTIAEDPDGDTAPIEHCVALATERWGDGEGGTVRTDSDVPPRSGTQKAPARPPMRPCSRPVTRSAGGWRRRCGPVRRRHPPRRLPTRGRAAREAGVTVTGAFDDATASMLGGVTVTDNDADELRSRETVDWDVLVWTPPERAYSADADVTRCEAVAPMADPSPTSRSTAGTPRR